MKIAVASAASAAAGAAAGAAAVWWLLRRRQGKPEVVREAISLRRSMFLGDINGDDAPEDVIHAMLEAANWAPTHGQTQPWRFTVMSRERGSVAHFRELQMKSAERAVQQGGDPETVDDLQKFLKKASKKAKALGRCSHLVAVSMKRQANPEKIMPEWEEIAAVSCAVQNAHIVACAMGVACYWSSGGIAALETAEVREYLGLADGDRCLGLIYVGMADADKWRGAQERAVRTPMSEKTVWK